MLENNIKEWLRFRYSSVLLQPICQMFILKYTVYPWSLCQNINKFTLSLYTHTDILLYLLL